jgi:hypothetical protein
VALDVHDVASAQVGDGLGHSGRLGLPQVDAAGDEALGVVDDVLAVDGGQCVPARAVQLERVVRDCPILGTMPSTYGYGSARSLPMALPLVPPTVTRSALARSTP